MSNDSVQRSSKALRQNKIEKYIKMKKIYKNQVANLISQAQQLRENTVELSKNKCTIDNPRQLSKENFQFQEKNTHLLEKVQDDQENICLACMSTNFEGGKYILDCSHILCNDCLTYWESVSQKCPVCNKKSNSILCIYNGQSRLKKVNFIAYIPNCIKCGKDDNYHLMYFCDSCDKNCTHAYCDVNLKYESQNQSWLCEKCIYKNYQEYKYEQESASQNSQQYQFIEDSFIVADDVIQYEDHSNVNEDQIKTKKSNKQLGKKKKGNKKRR